MLQGFKNFIMRGNVIELAVAVVIGAAFTQVVEAVVENVINPLLSGVVGEVDLADTWVVPLGGEPWLRFGAVAGALIQFLLTAAVVYFLIVLPMNRLSESRKFGSEPEPTAPAEDVLILQEIRDILAGRSQGTAGSPIGGAGPATGGDSARSMSSATAVSKDVGSARKAQRD